MEHVLEDARGLDVARVLDHGQGVAHDRLDARAREPGGQPVHGDRGLAERGELDPDARERLEVLRQRGGFGARHLDELGHEKALRLDDTGTHLGHQGLELDALVQGVLIDDLEAVLERTHDVGRGDLQERAR